MNYSFKAAVKLNSYVFLKVSAFSVMLLKGFISSILSSTWLWYLAGWSGV